MAEQQHPEYEALRAEVLARAEAERGAIRFYVPAAGVVYTMPFVLKSLDEPFLWSFCAAIGGLLVFAMVSTLRWSSDGAQRIGAYIQEAYEATKTQPPRWETFVADLVKSGNQSWWSEIPLIGAGAILANVGAAAAAGVYFLEMPHAVIPPIVAAVIAVPAAVAVYRIAKLPERRAWYSSKARTLFSPQKSDS